MSAQKGDAFGIEAVITASSGFAVGDQARVFEDAEVLGDGGAADRKTAGELVDGQWAGGEFLEYSHAGGVADGIESGL